MNSRLKFIIWFQVNDYGFKSKDYFLCVFMNRAYLEFLSLLVLNRAVMRFRTPKIGSSVSSSGNICIIFWKLGRVCSFQDIFLSQDSMSYSIHFDSPCLIVHLVERRTQILGMWVWFSLGEIFCLVWWFLFGHAGLWLSSISLQPNQSPVIWIDQNPIVLFGFAVWHMRTIRSRARAQLHTTFFICYGNLERSAFTFDHEYLFTCALTRQGCAEIEKAVAHQLV